MTRFPPDAPCMLRVLTASGSALPIFAPATRLIAPGGLMIAAQQSVHIIRGWAVRDIAFMLRFPAARRVSVPGSFLLRSAKRDVRVQDEFM